METLIGLEFSSNGTSVDLERTRRLRTDSKTGRLSENPERGVAKREFHVGPKLDLYLSEIAFELSFLSPVATPCLGRSQDLAWVKFVEKIELEPRKEGKLGPTSAWSANTQHGGTLVRFPNAQIGGLILPPLADYYKNSSLGLLREVGRFSRYQYAPAGSGIREQSDLRLYHPSDSDQDLHVIILHDLTK